MERIRQIAEATDNNHREVSDLESSTNSVHPTRAHYRDASCVSPDRRDWPRAGRAWLKPNEPTPSNLTDSRPYVSRRVAPFIRSLHLKVTTDISPTHSRTRADSKINTRSQGSANQSSKRANRTKRRKYSRSMPGTESESFVSTQAHVDSVVDSPGPGPSQTPPSVESNVSTQVSEASIGYLRRPRDSRPAPTPPPIASKVSSQVSQASTEAVFQSQSRTVPAATNLILAFQTASHQ